MSRARKKNIWPMSPSKKKTAQTTPASSRSAAFLRGQERPARRESTADRLNREFLERQRRPNRDRDMIDQAVDTGMEITGQIYAVPASLFEKGVQTTLQLKDAIKRQIGLNPCKQNGEPVYVYRRGGLEADGWQYFMTLQPANEAEWARYVRLAQQQPDRYRIVKTMQNGGRIRLLAGGFHPRGRRNPEDDAAEMYEKFHGGRSTHQVVIEKEFHEHEHLSALGSLVECWIETPTGLIAQIKFPEDPDGRPILASSEDGKQLYIEGGDQAVDLKVLGMDGKEWTRDRMVLGQFALPEGKRKHNISYETRKSFDDNEVVIYEHDLGEGDEGKRQRKEAPLLEFDPRNEQLYISGGNYFIRKPLVGVSPGIEH